jgi:DNA ligase-1
MFPKLYKIDTKGKIREWTIECDGPYFIITHGKSNGKMQVDKRFAKGKNAGKKNATTDEEQALLEAQSLWTKKKDSGYVLLEDLGNAKEFRVMKPHEFNAKKVIYPCYVQRKYDGVRLHINNGISLSKNNKEFYFLDHITEWCKEIQDKYNVYTDGELYHHEWDFEEIISKVRQSKVKPERIEEIKYVIYDIYDLDNNMNQRQRLALVEKIFNEYIIPNGIDSIVMAPTNIANNWKDIKRLHDMYVKDKYEGCIIRNKDGLYECRKTHTIMKYKEFKDDEFEIVDVIEGEGRETGLAIYVCQTKAKQPFNVRPKGSHSSRKIIFDNKRDYIGKMLTVRYQKLSKYGIPIFGRGIELKEKAIRDYE